MTTSRPSLSQAIVEAFRSSLGRTADHWIRAPLYYDWPVDEAIVGLDRTDSDIRVGVLRPFACDMFEKYDGTITDNPQRITEWRNEGRPSDPSAPTIVLGDASEHEEAGLKDLQEVVRPEEVIENWRASTLEWIAQHIDAEPVHNFIEGIFDLARRGRVDPLLLDEFVQMIPVEGDNVIESMRQDMWRLGLLPDRHALDTGNVSRRLIENAETVEFLETASDYSRTVKKLERLREAAAEGDKVAIGAEQYRNDGERSALQGVELSELNDILKVKRKRKSKSGRTLDLFDLLDCGPALGEEGLRQVMRKLEEKWSTSVSEEEEYRQDLECKVGHLGYSVDDLSDETQFEVTVERADEEDYAKWTAVISDESVESEDAHSDERVAYILASESEAGPKFNYNGYYTGEDLQRRVAHYDEEYGAEGLVEAVGQYLEARAKLDYYEWWMYSSLFELALLDPEARSRLREFLNSWLAVVKSVDADAPRDIREWVGLLEGGWFKRTDRSFEKCIISPLHPYRISPVLELVEYCLDHLGEERLGEKLQWALERSVPAYRGLWDPSGDMLYLEALGETVEYAASAEAHRPSARSGLGLYQVVKSFLGFYPFAKEGLVITLVDPPEGGAVKRNLKKVRREVDSLRVYQVVTGERVADIEFGEDIVRNLGRFRDIGEWMSESGVKSHLLFYFGEHRPGGDTGPSVRAEGARSGAHLALRAGVDDRPTLGGDSGPMPYVTFEPRSSNEAVVSLQRLVAPGDRGSRLFEVRPILDSDERRRLANLGPFGEWIVVGAPSPLGLVAPRELAGGVEYLGRESLGNYGLFVYSGDLFALRKTVTRRLSASAVTPDPSEVEDQLVELAVNSPKGVLRIGRAPQGNTLWEQIGMIVSSIYGEADFSGLSGDNGQ